jgi:hypothetical protein
MYSLYPTKELIGTLWLGSINEKYPTWSHVLAKTIILMWLNIDSLSFCLVHSQTKPYRSTYNTKLNLADKEIMKQPTHILYLSHKLGLSAAGTPP